MAIALVQATKFTGTSGAFASATTAGNCVVVCVVDKGNASNAPSVTAVTLGGSAGNFAQLVTTGSAVAGIAAIWADPNCAAGTAIAVTETNGTSPAVFIYEFSGVVSAFVLDKYNAGNGAGGTWSSGATGTLLASTEVVIGAAQASGGAITPPAGWTNQTQVNGSTNGAAGFQIPGSTASLTYNGTSAGTFFTAAVVSLLAASAGPPAYLNVSATGGGSAVNGTLLRVEVLDNAALPTALNTATQTSSATQAADAGITPAVTGSLAYSVVAVTGATPAAATGNTAIDSVASHGTFVSTATLTANTPLTAGSTAAVPGGVAVLEVDPFGGAITTDASSPAVTNNTMGTSASTTAFVPPPGGKLILALVSALGGTGQVAMAVTDTFGLTWTQAAAAASAGNDYAGIWYAYTPASLAFVNAAPDPGVVGTAYSYQLSASGGYSNYTWAVASGSLPAGLSLAGATGIISGTPTTAGLSTFTLTVTDGFGNSLTSSSISLVVNQGTTPGGVVRATWSGAAAPYSYGTLSIPVTNTDHDWLFVSVSWVGSEEQGIAYVSDDAHNMYEPCAFTTSGVNRTEVFCVPNARAASKVYVSTSAYVRWLTACVVDVTGLQPGFTVDVTPAAVSGGPGTTLNLSLSTLQPDFILACGAFRGTPGTITPSGTGATWTSITWGGINGNASDGLTQAVAWAETTAAASPAMTFTAASGTNSGCMVAVYRNGGLPANANPAWPVIKCQAAFGYLPSQPTGIPAWTDITSRFLGLKGGHGKNFELDEISAADITITLDNFDGALSPQNSGSPYYPNVTLITPVRVIATWQGRTYPVFKGIIHAIPQTYDFQRGMVEVAASDDWSKLAQVLLSQSMVQEMLYDAPLHLWPLNEQQGAPGASNWSGRSVQSLAPTPASLSIPVKTGGGLSAKLRFLVSMFGSDFVAELTAPLPPDPTPQQIWAGGGSVITTAAPNPGPPPVPTTPTTGFGNNLAKTWPSGLAGTSDSTWGNTTALTASNYYQGSVLLEKTDATLPLASSTWSVWAQMYYVPSNTSAVIMCVTDDNGTTGSKVYLKLSYDGTNITAAQTTGSHTFAPPSYLFDSKWHLWTVTISSGSVVTVKLDGVTLGSYTATFPAGTPTMVQWGGDSTATTASAAGIYTGSQYLAGVWDQVVDDERILSWAKSGITGYLDELAGQRIQRILTWARWSAPQAVDKGTTKQQQFDYLGGGYSSNGLNGAIGNFATAGGAIGPASGSQADMTTQDVANSENGSLFMATGGELMFRQRGGAVPDVGLALGDMDVALNSWQTFTSGLGPWTSTSGGTVAVSTGWSYANSQSALLTVTGTPSQAYVRGDFITVTPGQVFGFSAWVMSPQGCTVTLSVDFFQGNFGTYISTSSSPAVTLQPMTPTFINYTGITAPPLAGTANPGPTITSSPATGTQLYFDRPRLSTPGFQASYMPDVQVMEDVQYLYNDIVLTRNIDQAGYRARDATSRQRYYPRVYTRTVYTSANDPQAVVNVASDLLTQFSQPALRVARLVVNAAEDPENWAFVLAAGIGDSVSFTRTPVGGAVVTGTFTVLHIEPALGPDKAEFTYVLAPSGFK